MPVIESWSAFPRDGNTACSLGYAFRVFHDTNDCGCFCWLSSIFFADLFLYHVVLEF